MTGSDVTGLGAVCDYGDAPTDEFLESFLAEDDLALLRRIDGPAPAALRARILADAARRPRAWWPWAAGGLPALAAAAVAAVALPAWRPDPDVAPIPEFVAHWPGGAAERRAPAREVAEGTVRVPVGNLLTVRLFPAGAPVALEEVQVGVLGEAGFQPLEQVWLDDDGALVVVVPVRDIRSTPGDAVAAIALGSAGAAPPTDASDPAWRVVRRTIEVVADPL